jgi:hypothetical protein
LHLIHSAIAILHTSQFTVAHALGFSVFTSRIPATDLSQPHCNFKSHMKYSWYGLIPFLSFLLNHLRLPSPELDPNLDYYSIVLLPCLYYSSSQSQSQSHIATDGQSISKSWRRAPQIFITLWQLRSCFLGRSLWREDGSVFCTCYWSSPAQSFSGPSPLDLATIFYCLSFETSLFVASYDSQGHGGGIRPRLHTGDYSCSSSSSSPAEHFLWYLRTDSTENTDFYYQERLFTGPLSSNGCPIVAWAC